MAVERKGSSVLERSGKVRAFAWSEAPGVRDASQFCRLQSANASEIARGGRRRDRREQRFEPPFLAGLRSGGSDSLPRKTRRNFPRAHEGYRSVPRKSGKIRRAEFRFR